MSSVLKKADKLNLSLSLFYANRFRILVHIGLLLFCRAFCFQSVILIPYWIVHNILAVLTTLSWSTLDTDMYLILFVFIIVQQLNL